MRRRKYLIFGTLLFMVVVFATITTTLVLNGTLTIGTNTRDFGIYFSKSVLDSKDVSKETISTNGQVINFNTKLSEVGKTTELEYEVTNASRNYDAKVSVECQFKSEENNINFDDYITMNYPNNEEIIEARSTGTGVITLALKKVVLEEVQVGLECRLNFEGIERESLGEDNPNNNPSNYILSGYLTDEEGNVLENTYLVILDEERIYVTTNEEANLTIEGLDMGFHEIYVIENKTLEEIKDMTDEEIKENALTHATITQSTKEITFENGYKIVNKLVKEKYTVTFDTNGWSTVNAVLTVTSNGTYGELPIPTRLGYTFDGWYTESEGGTQITSSTTVDITSDQTLYAHWTVMTFEVTINTTEGGEVDKTSVAVNYGGSNTFTVTPSEGYYLSSISCTNGYTTNAQTGSNEILEVGNLIQSINTLSSKEYTPIDQTITVFNNQYGKGVCTVTFTSGALAYDKTIDNNLRYIGGNPNNYVEYNDELWRIIGVMNNFHDANGNKASHVKIIRDESIGTYSFDNKPAGTGSSTSEHGSNDWNDSRLMAVLNEGPYWNRTSGTCPNGANNATTACDFNNTGLTDEAKSMISKVSLNLGGTIAKIIEQRHSASYMYTIEESTEKWTGYVSLIYPSDYGYAIGGNNRDTYLAKGVASFDSKYYKANNWLYGNSKWTMLPVWDAYAAVVTVGTTLGYDAVYNKRIVRPVVYLDSNIQIVSGSGTSEEPYKLKLDNTSVSNPDTYTVTFDANGGDAVNTVLTVTSNGTYGELPTPIKEGYTFVGWYTEEDGGTRITSSTIVDITENQILYAHWKKGVAESETLVTYITNLAKTDTTNLAYDDTANKNLRYIGSNPNNYVEFNGEKWRIIGVMKDVEDNSGNIASRVKIIREESIASYVWNSNDWSTTAIQILLNSGDYYNRTNTYSNVGLTSTAKGMISNVLWNLGGRANSKAPASTFYSAERGISVWSGHATTWTGRIGLMYPSDYGYAVGGDERSACLEINLDEVGYGCYINNWLYLTNTRQWTISPDSSNSDFVVVVTSDGYLNSNHAANDSAIRPVVYLNTNITRKSGDGTKNNPYIIE